MRSMTIRTALLLAGVAAASIQALAVEMPRATIERNIDACQKMKRATDPTAPKDPSVLQSLCTCATEAYFAGYSDAEWQAIKKQASGKESEKARAAMAMKDRTDAAEIECRKTLKIEAPKE
jgi:hypothetical protein